MSKVYILQYSTGSYEDYRVHIHKVFSNPIDAEKEKEFLIKKMHATPLFPFDEEQDSFEERYYNNHSTKEEEELYQKWMDMCWEKEDFNRAWIEEYELN